MEIPLKPKLEEQLHSMARQSGTSEAALVEQALTEYLEDMEDISRAEKILAQNNRTWTQEEVKRELGLDFSSDNSAKS